jgi:hypothetical protein
MPSILDCFWPFMVFHRDDMNKPSNVYGEMIALLFLRCDVLSFDLRSESRGVDRLAAPLME